MRPKSKEFLDLKKVWYDKLKKEGFKDLEYDEDNLKKHDTTRFAPLHGRSPTQQVDFNNSKQEYFRLAGMFYWYHKFATPLEKSMWKMHQNGDTMREIAKVLTKRGHKCGKDKVCKEINKLADIMLKECNEQE